MEPYRFAVVGATGSVGRQTLTLLAERGVPFEQVVALASDRSLGHPVSYGDLGVLKIQSLTAFNFKNTDIAFFCVDAAVSKLYASRAVADGCRVIDKSSFFRLDPGVPLIVPEINRERLETALKKGIVSNPNCIAIPLALVLKPLDDAVGVKRVVVATYQSVSGIGKEGMDELHHQTRGYFVNDPMEPQYFPKKIAFNVIPVIDSFSSGGFTGEEEKIAAEIKKIVAPHIKVSATCVRVPVFIGHSMAVHVELKQPLTALAARDLLTKFPGVMVFDRPQEDKYITPLDVVGEDDVFVSRIRVDPTVDHGLALWISCDNLRKGAAVNAIQIAELLLKQRP